MITEVCKADDESIARAAKLLGTGELVAMPTETVYGLAANAHNEAAVSHIFEAKGRPQDNPLIVHISQIDMLESLAVHIPTLAYQLAEAFWPGPMTMVLDKSAQIPAVVSAGLSTVGIRFPSHPVAKALIEACGFPLAAPSANLSGRPSPTTAAHVLVDMDGRIPMILDGGPCKVGIESTVITVSENAVQILRPGGVTAQDLRTICPNVCINPAVLHELRTNEQAASPGMKYKHYAPKAHVVILDGEINQFIRYVEANRVEDTYALVFDGEESLLSVPCLAFGRADDGSAQAHALFDCLRQLDVLGARLVFARCPSKDGVGLAVYNRLIRAAGFEVIQL